jgi:hypothetical protein
METILLLIATKIIESENILNNVKYKVAFFEEITPSSTSAVMYFTEYIEAIKATKVIIKSWMSERLSI